MKIKTDNVQSFKAGMTLKLLKDFNRINIKEAENDFAKIGVDAKFRNNKFLCGSSVLTADILHEISGKYKLPFDFLPPAIRTYNEHNLVENVRKESGNSDAFCISDTKKVLLDEPPFIASSIFFNKKNNSSAIKEDIKSTFNGLSGYQSSTHFLHTVLHEWFHCIHNNLTFRKFGYEGNCPITKAQYGKPKASGLKKLLRRDIMFDVLLCYEDFVKKNISDYAAKNCLRSEIFAELMSKITAKSLNSKLEPITNPLDFIPKNLPKSIQRLLEETLEI